MDDMVLDYFQLFLVCWPIGVDVCCLLKEMSSGFFNKKETFFLKYGFHA